MSWGVWLVSSPVCWLLTSTWSPPRFLAWQKGSWRGSGLIWRRLGPLLLVGFLGLPAGKIGDLPLGSRRDFMVGCPRAAAAVSGCEVVRDRWVVPHFAVRTCFDYSRWLARVSLPIQRTLCGRPLGYQFLIRVGGRRLLRLKGFGIYTMKGCSLCLGMML